MTEELHLHITVTNENTKRVLLCTTCDVQLMEFTGMPHERRLAESAIDIHTNGPKGMNKQHNIVTLRLRKDNALNMSEGLVTEGDMWT